MGKSLYLIDGHAQIYRAYYAPFTNLSAPSGEPTRATHVFSQMLLNLLRDRRPDYLAVVLDADESKVFRREIYPEYKAQREPAPEDLAVQEHRILEILKAAHIPQLAVEGFEADDILATLARRLAGADLHVYLVSKDKDLDQVLNPHVSLYDPAKDEVVTPERLLELKGWTPAQAIDAQTLIGDSVDNVPGVPGIGPKTAAKLLQKYGDVAGVLANAAELSPRQRENLLAFAPQLERTRALVTLRDDVPISFDPAAAAVERFNWSAAARIFKQLGFRRLTEQVETLAAATSGRANPVAEDAPTGTTGQRPATTPATGPATAPAAGSATAPAAGSARGHSRQQPVRAEIESLFGGLDQPGDEQSPAPAPAAATTAAGRTATRRSTADKPADGPAADKTALGSTSADSAGTAAHLDSADQDTSGQPAAPPLSGAEHAPLARMGLSAEAAAQLSLPDGGDYRLVNTPAALAELLAELAEQPEFAVDTETTSTSPVDAELIGVALSWSAGRGWYLPVRSMYGDVLPLELLRERLAPLLADPARRKVGHNLKYDLIVLQNHGLPVAGTLFDTMLAAFVLDPTRSSYGLDGLVAALLNHRMIPIQDLIGRGRDALRLDQAPLEHVAEYSAEDADYTWRLRQLLAPPLESAGLAGLYYETEMPLVRVLAQMEQNGITLDAGCLRDMGRELADRAEQRADEVQALVGQRFNLDSPKQLADVLFNQLKLRIVRRTRTGASTDAETLATLFSETRHPALQKLLEYRELQKLLGTYVEALPKCVSRRTGRVHTSYHQTGAVTGRLSSSEPNLQNIPIRTELGRQIRRAFVPRTPDETLIVADYSQIELRVLAHYCEDENLIGAFREDRDIHAFVAAQVNGVPLAAVTRDMRSRAKAVNFGIIYGQSAFGLAQTTGLSRTEAQAFIDQYFRRYPRIRAFIDACIATARRTGEVRTILGRRRPIDQLDSRNQALRAQAERFAVNTVIQGSAADLLKIAMVRLHARIEAERLPLRMLLQVHDELVCEGPRAEAGRLMGVLQATMSGAAALRVPLKVEVAAGDNWLDAK